MNSVIELTYNDVKQYLMKAVTAMPDRRGDGEANLTKDDAEDFFYNTCLYTYPNGTHCIVGQVLHDAGVDIQPLNGYELGVGHVITEVLADQVIMDEKGQRLLEAAQAVQDQGVVWADVAKLLETQDWLENVPKEEHSSMIHRLRKMAEEMRQ